MPGVGDEWLARVKSACGREIGLGCICGGFFFGGFFCTFDLGGVSQYVHVYIYIYKNKR